MEKKKNVIVEITFNFTIELIEFCEMLNRKGKKIVSHQLMKSGTSIGANIHEAQSSESKKDFIHKLKIAAKEAEETYYWLYICKNVSSYPYEPKLLNDLISIKKILSKIISTSKKQLVY